MRAGLETCFAPFSFAGFARVSYSRAANYLGHTHRPEHRSIAGQSNHPKALPSAPPHHASTPTRSRCFCKVGLSKACLHQRGLCKVKAGLAIGNTQNFRQIFYKCGPTCKPWREMVEVRE